ncbi:MAG: flagellar motor switch protein FliN [Alphaproteobacteria bacterium]
MSDDGDLVLDNLDDDEGEMDMAAAMAEMAREEAASGGHKPGDDDDTDRVRTARELETVYDIPVQVSAVLGKSQIQVANLLRLGPGAIVELDRKVGEPIDIFVNNRLVARGEVVVVDDRLGVTMTEIIKSDRS